MGAKMKRQAIRVWWDEIERDDGDPPLENTVRKGGIVGYVPRGVNFGLLVGNLRQALIAAKEPGVSVFAEVVDVKE